MNKSLDPAYKKSGGDEANGKQVSDVFHELVVYASQKSTELKRLYPSVSKPDPRYGTAFNIRSIISSSYLASALFYAGGNPRDLLVLHGYQSILEIASNEQNEIDCYAMFCAWGLIVLCDAQFEHGINQLLKNPLVSSEEKSMGKKKIINFFKELEDSGWSFSLGDPRDLFNVFRAIRNTIHNNCIFNPGHKPESYTWRGKEYIFNPGEKREFYIIELIQLVRDLVELNFQIMNSRFIRSLAFD